MVPTHLIWESPKKERWCSWMLDSFWHWYLTHISVDDYIGKTKVWKSNRYVASLGPQQTNKCEDISEGQQAMFSLVLDPLVQWVSPDLSCNVQLSPDLSSYVQMYPDMFSNVRPCPDRSSHIQFQELFPSLQTPAPLIKSRYKSNTEQKYWELSNPISPLLKTHWIVDTTRKNHCFIFRVKSRGIA